MIFIAVVYLSTFVVVEQLYGEKLEINLINPVMYM